MGAAVEVVQPIEGSRFGGVVDRSRTTGHDVGDDGEELVDPSVGAGGAGLGVRGAGLGDGGPGFGHAGTGLGETDARPEIVEAFLELVEGMVELIPQHHELLVEAGDVGLDRSGPGTAVRPARNAEVAAEVVGLEGLEAGLEPIGDRLAQRGLIAGGRGRRIGHGGCRVTSCSAPGPTRVPRITLLPAPNPRPHDPGPRSKVDQGARVT